MPRCPGFLPRTGGRKKNCQKPKKTHETAGACMGQKSHELRSSFDTMAETYDQPVYQNYEYDYNAAENEQYYYNSNDYNYENNYENSYGDEYSSLSKQKTEFLLGWFSRASFWVTRIALAG